MDRENPQVGRILEEAACIVSRCKETAGNAKQTESCKRRQIEELKQYANSNKLWIDIHSLPTVYLDIPYGMIGFAYNSRKEFSAVLFQPYIPAKREATEHEIVNYMIDDNFIIV